MDCNSIVTWENILRPAIRVIEGGCNAIALDTMTRTSSGGVECDNPGLLTRFAMASADTVLYAQYYASGEQVVPGCDLMPFTGTEELLSMVLDESDEGTVFIVHEPAGIAHSCERDCDEEAISTEEMVRRTVVRVADTFWALQVVAATAEDAIDCEGTEEGTETLIRSALMPVGDGTYAWRYTQEEAAALGGFTIGFSSGFDT